MARPVRAAALRARELWASGLGQKIVAAEEEDEEAGMSSGEEEELDAALCDDSTGDELEEESDTGGSTAGSDAGWGGLNQDDDGEPDIPDFRPVNPVGPQLKELSRKTGKGYVRAVDIFTLFFTKEIIEMICYNTNIYGALMILSKQSYANRDGSWEEVSVDEMYAFIGLLVMMGFHKIADIGRRWAQATLYAGGWSARYMSRTRYKAIAGMIHVADPSAEDPADKLTKLRPIIDYLKARYGELYQPSINLSVDERMVKSKARIELRQYMPGKPVRFGYKVWCICEATTGYTLDFDVYTGRKSRPAHRGLAFDVVATLVSRYAGQGYHIYFDSFFTSIALLRYLVANGLAACGTTRSIRRGLPKALKDKTWEKRSKKGDRRFVSKSGILCLQWHDKKAVYVCSTMHKGADSVSVRRHKKRPDGSHEAVRLPKPRAIQDYNNYMGGVDLSDQLLTPYSMLHKSRRWWRTLFYHMIDMTILNCFLIFKKWQEMNPDVPELQRPAGYSHLAFREELARQLARVRDDEDPPVSVAKPRAMSYFAMEEVHVPIYQADRRNCRVCSVMQGKPVRTHWSCSHPTCNNSPVCLNKERNCYQLWHTNEFQRLICKRAK